MSNSIPPNPYGNDPRQSGQPPQPNVNRQSYQGQNAMPGQNASSSSSTGYVGQNQASQDYGVADQFVGQNSTNHGVSVQNYAPGMIDPSHLGYNPDKPRNSSGWVAGAIIVALLLALGILLALVTSPNPPEPQVPVGESTGVFPDPIESEREQQGTDDASPSADDEAAMNADQEREMIEALATLARRDAADTHAIGAVDAPVVMIEYSDLTCPYCGKFALETLPQIMSDYVDQGLVRLEWRDLPIFGEPSQNAALGGRAAGVEGKFWEYQDAFYRAGIPREEVTREAVLGVAQSIGIEDLAAFEAAFENQELQQAIANDYQEGQHIGVQSTPTFLINGRPLMGAAPYEDFKAVIDLALSEEQ
ncbi:DsbA family protein [Populibacterium corticicola]|uniref:DsbA family protein n=1 Tax=Populibacterium corticicola TaxID=1812826 RepID=A0ABW5XDP1_9MICO